MPVEQYTLVRADSIIGDLSEAGEKSDALKAVEVWQRMNPGRKYRVDHEDAHKLIVTLEWQDNDKEAGETLHAVCIKHGVKQDMLQ